MTLDKIKIVEASLAFIDAASHFSIGKREEDDAPRRVTTVGTRVRRRPRALTPSLT